MRLTQAATELLDLVKKNLYYGRALDSTKVCTLLDQTEALAAAARVSMTKPGAPQPLNADSRITHAIVGFGTEGGELCKALADHLEGADLDIVNLGEEFFDADWYKAIFLDATGISEEMARYPDKFDARRALHRDLGAERAILESFTQ